MKIAHIVPSGAIEPFVSNRRFHLVLAHMVKNDAVYRSAYRKLANRGDEIILDNSSFELGDDVYSANQLIEIANMVGACTIMAPETLEDSQSTIKKVSDFKSLIDNLDPTKKVFATIHGKTIADFINCHFAFKTLEVDTIGFSCRLDVQPGSVNMSLTKTLQRSYVRYFIVKSLYPLLYNNIQYHLLGMNHPIELMWYYNYPLIKSCDSSSAWVHGIENKDLSFQIIKHFTKSKNPIVFKESEISDDKKGLVRKNMDFLDTISKFTAPLTVTRRT